MNVLENVILIGFLGSLVAGLGTAIGAAGVFGLRQLTPRSEDLLLSSAAGVMLYIISHEIIPETHRSGHATPATFALLGGFAAMMFLDVALD